MVYAKRLNYSLKEEKRGEERAIDKRDEKKRSEREISTSSHHPLPSLLPFLLKKTKQQKQRE